MRTIRLLVEYDGTNYSGWQVQANGTTVQGVLEDRLSKMLGHAVRVTGAGRTDAGVHARGMVAAFTTDKGVPLRAFTAGLNAVLPQDIAIHDAAEMPPEFHPRFSAVGKHYRYSIFTGKQRSPLRRFTSWHIRAELDLEAMRRAAEMMVGEHDYAAFRTAGCAASTTVRTIWSMELHHHSDQLCIDVKGRGFLRNMVRIMTGTLVEVGEGRRDPLTIAELLRNPSHGRAGATAPPQGLCLMQVYYGEVLKDFLLDTAG
jgi:tRNA pseudouridine38-40 synthase